MASPYVKLLGLLMVFLGTSAVDPLPSYADDDTKFVLPDRAQPVKLLATIENKPTEVSGTFRVRLTSSVKLPLIIVGTPTDFVSADQGNGGTTKYARAAIAQSNIHIDDRALSAGQAADMQFTVKGITQTGYYEGSIQLSVRDHPGIELMVPVTLRVGAKPIIEIEEKAFTFSASNCSSPCWFTNLVSPGSAVANGSYVTLVNKSLETVSARVVGDIRGAGGERVLIGSKGEVALSPGERAFVGFDLNRERLPADHYNGSLVAYARSQASDPLPAIRTDGSVDLQNQGTATTPLTVDIRVAALWPFLLVLIGVLIARLYKVFGTPDRIARISQYPKYRNLTQAIGSLRDAGAKLYCRSKLEDIWDQMLSGSPADAKLQEDWSGLEHEIAILKKLESIEAELDEANLGAAIAEPIRGHVVASRKAIMDGQLSQAEAELGSARTSLENAMSTSRSALPRAEELKIAFDNARTAIKNWDTVQTPGGWWRRTLRGLLALFAGSDTTPTVAIEFWVVGPIVFWGVTLLLAYYGLTLIYGGADHAAFGSRGLTDYVAAFLWGFGAQIATLSLQDISLRGKS